MKQKIRHLVKENRLKRTLENILVLNNSIKENLFSYFDFSKYKNILIYLSCLEKGEVDTWNIIKRLKKYNLYVPQIDNNTNKMFLTKYNEKFIRNKYGIFECWGKKVYVTIDIAIIPMLAFDTNGNRIGFGKGYFDSFLSKLDNVTSVGLCMESPHDKWKPELHDIPLNYVVTPKKIYKF